MDVRPVKFNGKKQCRPIDLSYIAEYHKTAPMNTDVASEAIVQCPMSRAWAEIYMIDTSMHVILNMLY